MFSASAPRADRRLARRRGFLAAGLFALAVVGRPDSARVLPPAAGAADLAAGMEAVERGDFQAAVGFLSRAVRAMGPEAADREGDLVKAQLHLGVAFAGLGQDSPARSQFAQALLRRPDARLEVKGAPERARSLFEEAKEEAAPVIAAGAEGARKPKKTVLMLGGLAVVGTGVGVATVAGGDASTPSTSLPPVDSLEPARTFRFASISGNPFLAFMSGDPQSGTTIAVGTVRPRFVFRVQMSTVQAPVGPFSRLQAVVELATFDRGPCWRAESVEFALAFGDQVDLVFDGFPAQPACPPPFNTLTVEAKLFDRAAGRQVGATVYTGGYKVVP